MFSSPQNGAASIVGMIMTAAVLGMVTVQQKSAKNVVKFYDIVRFQNDVRHEMENVSLTLKALLQSQKLKFAYNSVDGVVTIVYVSSGESLPEHIEIVGGPSLNVYSCNLSYLPMSTLENMYESGENIYLPDSEHNCPSGSRKIKAQVSLTNYDPTTQTMLLGFVIIYDTPGKDHHRKISLSIANVPPPTGGTPPVCEIELTYAAGTSINPTDTLVTIGFTSPASSFDSATLTIDGFNLVATAKTDTFSVNYDAIHNPPTTINSSQTVTGTATNTVSTIACTSKIIEVSTNPTFPARGDCCIGLGMCPYMNCVSNICATDVGISGNDCNESCTSIPGYTTDCNCESSDVKFTCVSGGIGLCEFQSACGIKSAITGTMQECLEAIVPHVGWGADPSLNNRVDIDLIGGCYSCSDFSILTAVSGYPAVDFGVVCTDGSLTTGTGTTGTGTTGTGTTGTGTTGTGTTGTGTGVPGGGSGVPGGGT